MDVPKFNIGNHCRLIPDYHGWWQFREISIWFRDLKYLRNLRVRAPQDDLKRFVKHYPAGLLKRKNFQFKDAPYTAVYIRG